MATYIEREAVEKFIENGLNNPNEAKRFGHDAIEIMAEVHYMPAADVAPVLHGRWLCGEDYMFCSKCGMQWNYCDNDTQDFKYCPNCGAKMDGGDDRG